MCKTGATHLPRTEEQGDVNILSPRIEGIHNLSVGISSGTLILLLILIVGYVLVKTGVVTCCGYNARNRRQEQQRLRRKELGREHNLEELGSAAFCRRCNKRAYTA